MKRLGLMLFLCAGCQDPTATTVRALEGDDAGVRQDYICFEGGSSDPDAGTAKIWAYCTYVPAGTRLECGTGAITVMP